MANKSKERAIEILNLYTSQIVKYDFVKSVILVGSLSDDTYTGNLGSDIDLINIVNAENFDKARKQLLDFIQNIEDITNHDIPISRTIYRYHDILHPNHYDMEFYITNHDYIDLPIEILRIKDTGKTVYGEDILSEIELPTKEDILKCTELSKSVTAIHAQKDPSWYKTYLNMCDKPTIRLLVQIVLTTSMSEYYFSTGHNCSSKYRILECMEEEVPECTYLSLLRLCHKWRFNNDEITQYDINTMEEEYQIKFKKRKSILSVC